MLRLERMLSWLWLCSCLAACGAGDYDPSGDPNDDRNWATVSYGIADLFQRVPSGTLASDAAPLCEVLDLNGDQVDDASRAWTLEFTDSPTNIGQFSAIIFSNNTLCSGDPDWQDVLEFTYTIATANFEFNRIDGEVLNIGRKALTSSGEDLLNSGNACGRSDWAMNTLVSADACQGGVADELSYFHLDAQSQRRTLGEQVKGLYIYLPPYFTYQIGSHGQRPDANDIAGYDGSVLLGDPLYVSTQGE